MSNSTRQKIQINVNLLVDQMMQEIEISLILLDSCQNFTPISAQYSPFFWINLPFYEWITFLHDMVSPCTYNWATQFAPECRNMTLFCTCSPVHSVWKPCLLQTRGSQPKHFTKAELIGSSLSLVTNDVLSSFHFLGLSSLFMNLGRPDPV